MISAGRVSNDYSNLALHAIGATHLSARIILSALAEELQVDGARSE